MEIDNDKSCCNCLNYFYWLCTLYVLSKILSKLWTITDQYILTRYKEIDFKNYGQWAVLTGGTDGIGKGFAQVLARKGMKICLVGRDEAKLKNVLKEIEEQSKVSTKFIVADLAHQNVYDHIKKNLNDLDIGVLVHSAGIINEDTQLFSHQTERFTQDFINVRITSITMLTHIVLQGMMARKRGLILNISSYGSEIVIPYLAEYSAIKSYVTKFGQSVSHELRKHNIQMTTFISGIIQTRMVDQFSVGTKLNLIKKWFPFVILTPEEFATSALEVVKSGCAVSCGYIVYDLVLPIMKILPAETWATFAGKKKLN